MRARSWALAAGVAGFAVLLGCTALLDTGDITEREADAGLALDSAFDSPVGDAALTYEGGDAVAHDAMSGDATRPPTDASPPADASPPVDASTTADSSNLGEGGMVDAAPPLGPGAAYTCTSSGRNAWDTYGMTVFFAVNEAIFTNVGNVFADSGTANLGASFTEVGSGTPPSTSDPMPTFKGKLAAFLVYAYGGPTSITYTDGITYGGMQDMTAAHTGLEITSDQYTYFVSNVLVPALSSSGVSTADITSCFGPMVEDSTFMASIVGH